MKKAIAVTELTLILLAVVAGVGLIFLVRQSVEKVGCMSDVVICKNTYLTFKKIKEKAALLGIAPRLDCATISPPNCKETELKTENKQKTMHIIAENLRWCWDKTLGKQNTMGKDFAGYALIVGLITVIKNVDFCLVCSEFKPNVDIPAAEWNDYLKNKKISRKEQTYAGLIDPVGQEIWKKRYQNYDKPIAFEKGKKYYVVSVSAEATEPTKEKNQAFIYIDSEIVCGDKRPQIHYQLSR